MEIVNGKVKTVMVSHNSTLIKLKYILKFPPTKCEKIPQAMAEMLIIIILSGRCIKPVLHSIPNPSALALV